MTGYRVQVDWNGVLSTMIAFVVVVGMSRILSRMVSERPALLAQTARRLSFATAPLEVSEEDFARWVEEGKLQLLQAGGYYREGRKPTLAVLDDKIYAVVRYGSGIALLSVRWEDLSWETVQEVEEQGMKIAGVALVPELRRKDSSPQKVSVECPVCREVIEVRDWGAVTRTGALRRHIMERHAPRGIARALLPQVLTQGARPVPPEYRYLTGWIGELLPEYSLATLLPAVEAEAKERKVEAVLRQLKDGVEGIQDSYQFRLFLTTMAKFHEYSIGNTILIMIQKPGATRVAGFNTWKDLGRWVRGGEKGIAILAPVLPPRPSCARCGARLGKGARFCPQCGQEVELEEETGATPRYFKVVYVFDVSQTEGKPLPEFEVPVLTGEANEELFARVMALARAQGLEVSFEPRPHQDPSIKGQYFGKTIWVRPEEPRAQQLKTLLHEVAHYYSEGVFRIPRSDAETIAESAAFVVGAHHGFDTGVRSFPYVALWAKDKKVLEQNLGAIRKVATQIIQTLEQAR